MRRPIWEAEDPAEPPLPQPGTRRAAHRLGHLILTTTDQPRDAPIIDRATVRDSEGRVYRGIAILRGWWQRRRLHQPPSGEAVVIGWQVQAGGAPAGPPQQGEGAP